MTRDQIEDFLDTEFKSFDLGDTTPRKYLHELLVTLWKENDGFSSKRPFGNSGWESDLAHALVKSGHVAGSIDEDGWVQDPDWNQVDRCVTAIISHIFFSR